MIKVDAQVIGVNKVHEVKTLDTFLIALAAEVIGGLLVEFIKQISNDIR